jgi:hypothetical protein
MSANAQIIVSMRNQADPEVRKLASSFRDLIQKLRDAGATQEQAERKALAHAQALAQLASKSGQAATAERLLAAALTQVNRESTAAVRATTQMVAVQNRMAQSWSTTALTEFKQGLVGIVGPAAAAMGALNLLVGTVQSFKEAFIFKTQLDATTASINLQLRGVRDMTAVWAQGQAVAGRYKLTQAELTSVMQSSVQVLRQSKSGADDLITTLLRLQSTAPEKPIEEAARALRELQSGDTTTIKELFNISVDNANQMKAEILAGADAVQVLSEYLTSAGAGMQVLETRTKGAMGALNDLKVAQEELTLAQAEWAQGPGLALTQTYTETVRGLTRALGGGGGLAEAFQQLDAQGAGRIAFNEAYSEALRQGKTEAEALTIAERAGAQAASDRAYGFQQTTSGALQSAAAAAQAAAEARGLATVQDTAADAARKYNQAMIEQTQETLNSALQTQQLASFQRTLADLGGAVASGLISDAEAAAILGSNYSFAKDEAAKLIQMQAELARAKIALANAENTASVARAVAASRAAGREGRGDSSDYANQNEAANRIAQERAAAQKRLAIEEGGPAAALKIARAELAKLQAGTAAYINKQAEIVALERQVAALNERGERAADRAGKAKIKDAREVLNLTERTADSQEKQLRAALDARLGALDDRKERRIEARQLAAAQRLLASGRGSADQRAAAEDVLQRIPLEQQRRALDIAGKSRDAGGTIIGGKLYGSQPGAGGLPALPGAPAGSLPTIPALPNQAASTPGGVGGVIQFAIDGRVIAEAIVPYTIGQIRSGFHAARAGGSGGG